MADRCKKKAFAAIVVLHLLQKEEKAPRLKKRKTREWMKKRVKKGLYANLILELSAEDPLGFREMMRMSRDQFSRDFGQNTALNFKAIDSYGRRPNKCWRKTGIDPEISRHRRDRREFPLITLSVPHQSSSCILHRVRGL